MLRAYDAQPAPTVDPWDAPTSRIVRALDDEFLEELAADCLEDVIVLELSPQEEAELYADILERYNELAQTPRLAQTSIVECYVAATLTSIAATREGRVHLESLVEPLGGGLHHATLIDMTGERISVIVEEPRTRGVTEDPALAILARAIATANADEPELDPYGSCHSSIPFAVMSQLGLRCPCGTTRALRAYEFKNGDSLRVGSPDASTLARYGLQPLRSYTVVGSFHDRLTGEPKLVLHDPWGSSQPAPIPESVVPSLFRGLEPATGTGTLRPSSPR